MKDIDNPSPENSRRGRVEVYVRRLQETLEFIQATIAAEQQRMEDSANQQRAPSEQYRVGDKVWLHLRNIKTQRPSKKLDWLHAEYTMTKVVDSYTIELNVPRKIHPRFYINLL